LRKEESEMKKKLIAGFLVAGSCLFAAPMFAETRFSVGVGVGVPVGGYGYAAPAPGPGFVWTDGYWFGEGRHRVWRQGYWAAPRAHFERRGDGSRVLPPVVKPRGVTNPENGFLP
jgi:hypothetical protein